MSPPLLMLFPPLSFNCTVIVEVELPSAVIEVGLAKIRLAAVSAVTTGSGFEKLSDPEKAP